MCIDYRKLNSASRNDHFPLPFIDQMLERLANHPYYCFLDGYSGFFQIPIHPDDQEKTRVGLVAGVEGEYYATRWLGIAAGVNYAMQGWVMNAEQSVATKLDYLNIPVTANFYVAGGLALKAGAQLGFLLYAKQLGVDIKDNCRKLSVAIPVGISYEFGNVVFDACYNFALTKVNKHKSVVNDGRSDLIQLTLGHKFEW